MIYKIHFKARVEATKTAWQNSEDGRVYSDRLVCSIERTIPPEQADESTPFFYIGEVRRAAVYPAIFIFPIQSGDFRFQLSPVDLTMIQIPEGVTVAGLEHAQPAENKYIAKALALAGECHRVILEMGRDCPEAANVVLNSRMTASAEAAILRDSRKLKTRLSAVHAVHMLLRWDYWTLNDTRFPTLHQCVAEMEASGFDGGENGFKELRKKLALPPIKRAREN